MREYFEKVPKTKKDSSIIRILLCLLSSSILFLFFIFLSSLLFLYTNIDEKFELFFVIIITSVIALTISLVLVIITDFKPIFSAVITICYITTFKLLINVFLKASLGFSFFSILSLILIVVFSIIGAIGGSKLKK